MCDWPRCRQPAILTYAARPAADPQSDNRRGLCGIHWQLWIDLHETGRGAFAYRKLRLIPAAPRPIIDRAPDP